MKIIEFKRKAVAGADKRKRQGATKAKITVNAKTDETKKNTERHVELLPDGKIQVTIANPNTAVPTSTGGMGTHCALLPSPEPEMAFDSLSTHQVQLRAPGAAQDAAVVLDGPGKYQISLRPPIPPPPPPSDNIFHAAVMPRGWNTPTMFIVRLPGSL